MNIMIDKLVKINGHYEGNLKAVDLETAKTVAEYKKNICKSFVAINKEQINSKFGHRNYYVTKKLDGEFNVIFFNGEDIFIINSGSKVRMKLPCLEEIKEEFLKSKRVTSAIIPAELYVKEINGRTRVFDVLSTLSKEDELKRLCIAPFDIIEINGELNKFDNFKDVHTELDRIFGNIDSATPVMFEEAHSANDIMKIYEKWVEGEKAEGLIIRSDIPVIYKLKPKHNIDVVVVGFTESSEFKGQIRTLLLALVREDNNYQIIGRTGGGMNEKLKKQLYEKLLPETIESEYVETDSSYAAFHMVKPELVIEISINDVIFETNKSFILNPVLEIKDNKYILVGQTKGISIIYPIFNRIRDDKKADNIDARFSQIADNFYLEDIKDSIKVAKLPKSELLFREVYKKESGGKLMVQKFMVWKTNKDEIDSSYPPYVMSYTNFSSSRKEPLQKEVRISSSKEQIFSITEKFISGNIKKGWKIVE